MSGVLERIHEGARVALRSVHGKYLSAQPDGRAEWNRDHASTWEHFHLEKRQGGKIALKGVHGMYVSAQPDGSVQINRRAAPSGGWEEFTDEDRGNNVVCLKSCHGKYLSAQQNGTAQWNRDHAPRGGWEEIQIEQYRKTSEPILNSDSGMIRGESILVSEHSLPRYNGIYTTQNTEINGKPWFKNNSGCILYFYNANSGGGPSWSLDDRSQDGTNDWFRGGWIEPPNSGGPPLGTRRWEEAGTRRRFEIKMESVSKSAIVQAATIPADTTPPSVTVSGAGSTEVNGTYVFKPGEHENRHWNTIAGHYQHTQNPEIFIAFQDCGTAHQRPEWNKWMIISKIGVLYAAHTGGKIGVPPRDGGWETVDSWGNPGAPGGKHPAPTVRPGENKDSQRIEHPSETSSQGNFEFVPISEYDEVWNDKGSGAREDVSVWRARVPRGCHLLGMTAKNGHSQPTFSTMVIRADGNNVVPPERFDLVWWQERGQRRFWCWRPVPPPGYVSLGDVGTLSDKPPSWKEVVCVSLDCLSPKRQTLGRQIWNDRGGGAPKDAAFFEQPGGTGLFHCSDDTHNKPHGEFRLPASTSTSTHATKEIEGIEILEPVATVQIDEERNNSRARIALGFGILLLIIGLPLFIGGLGTPGEESLGMIIPGAILFGVGGFLTLVASLTSVSFWAESYAESGKTPPKWPRIVAVCAALLLIPGTSLLALGIASSGALHYEDTTSANLLITDADGLGDQGFIIFIKGTPGDLDENGIHDYCEAVVVNARHSGSWISEPWTSTASRNEPDSTRQAFEPEIAHPGSGCSADVWPEQKGDLVKVGRACYGCMAGTTEITAFSNDLLYEVPMWIQDGEKIVESIGILVAGSFMLAISGLTLAAVAVFSSKLRESMVAHIEVLQAIEGKPVKFRINDPPSNSSAWVGIYSSSAPDDDHGEEGVRWHWLSEIDARNATFPKKSAGRWSIRVFEDRGFTLDRRLDFDILPQKERWWED